MHNSSIRGPKVQLANHLLLAIVTAVLAACGGGGGGSDNGGTGAATTTSSASSGNAAPTTGSTVTAQSAQPAVFRVNTETAGQQTLADIGALQDGGYAVTWVSRTNAGTTSLHLQRFDASSQRAG